MKAIHLAALTVLAAVSAWASSPVVSNVSLEQKSAKRAEITYTLSEDAVVTLDIVTNAPGGGWASIGAENVVKVWGDVNKLVTGAGTHTLSTGRRTPRGSTRRASAPRSRLASRHGPRTRRHPTW